MSCRLVSRLWQPKWCLQDGDLSPHLVEPGGSRTPRRAKQRRPIRTWLWLGLADNWKISKYCLRVHAEGSECGTKMVQGRWTLSQFQSHRTCAPITPCVVTLKTKKWLTNKHSEYWNATPSMRQSRSSFKNLWWNCLETYWPGHEMVQTCKRIVNWPLHTEMHLYAVDVSHNAPCRKCGQEEDSSWHTLSAQDKDLWLCMSGANRY
jgi:hypothetical protein